MRNVISNRAALAKVFGYDGHLQVIIDSATREEVKGGTRVENGHDVRIPLSKGYKAIEAEIEKALNLCGRRVDGSAYYNVRIGRWYADGPIPSHVRISLVHAER